MQKEQNLVRKLAASETMGGANVIVTDKTGTLTENMMTVKGLFTGDSIHMDNIDSLNFENVRTNHLIVDGVVYNSTAHVERKAQGALQAVGNATE